GCRLSDGRSVAKARWVAALALAIQHACPDSFLGGCPARQATPPAYDPGMLYGRDAERAPIRALLGAASGSRSGSLILRGEPGVGKTALLDDTRERASDMHVLTARGVQSESEFPYAGLHQLMRPAFGHVDQLPAPQAVALRVALGLGAGAAPERFL